VAIINVCFLLVRNDGEEQVVTILYNMLISNFQIKNVSLLRSCSETPNNNLIYLTEFTERQ
jgi:hypothetical protein